ncbi:hypothetical protein DQQ10_24230 [Pseudochryseolinea flava]|uniref:Uncharacterized protein n=2 Tax=Pseudochryseolinea flava TaxID=2059302 RepID=A0A364XWT9_9BACT|nr:hypothetical protein DQQ10_24230 [Pseudochryseolinea flava]
MNIPVKRYSFFKWVVVSLTFSIGALYVTTFFLGDIVIEMCYGDKTWMLYDGKHRLAANFMYYGFNVLILMMLNLVYNNIARRIQSQSNNSSQQN